MFFTAQYDDLFDSRGRTPLQLAAELGKYIILL